MVEKTTKTKAQPGKALLDEGQQIRSQIRVKDLSVRKIL